MKQILKKRGVYLIGWIIVVFIGVWIAMAVNRDPDQIALQKLENATRDKLEEQILLSNKKAEQEMELMQLNIVAEIKVNEAQEAIYNSNKKQKELEELYKSQKELFESIQSTGFTKIQ